MQLEDILEPQLHASFTHQLLHPCNLCTPNMSSSHSMQLEDILEPQLHASPIH
jgi:hypothetical protein